MTTMNSITLGKHRSPFQHFPKNTISNFVNNAQEHLCPFGDILKMIRSKSVTKKNVCPYQDTRENNKMIYFIDNSSKKKMPISRCP